MAPDILQLLPELGDNVSRLQEHGQVPAGGTGLQTEFCWIGSSWLMGDEHGSEEQTRKAGDLAGDLAVF